MALQVEKADLLPQSAYGSLTHPRANPYSCAAQGSESLSAARHRDVFHALARFCSQARRVLHAGHALLLVVRDSGVSQTTPPVMVLCCL
jgi:hypothetical protein